MRKLKKGRARRYRARLRRKMYVPSLAEARFYAAINALFEQIANDYLFDGLPHLRPK